MPAYTPIREFIDALKSGETNITRRLKYLVQNYNQIPQSVRDSLDGWTPSADHPAMPEPVKKLLMHDGDTGPLTSVNKLGQPEIDHIDDWPWQQKAIVKDWVGAAKNNPAAEIYWELHRNPALGDYADHDPGNPLKVTCRTFAGRVNLGLNFGSINYQ